MSEATVTRHTAEVHADVTTARPLNADVPGQRFLPQTIKVYYVWKVSCGWKIMSIFVAGPIVRKRDGALSSRSTYQYFNAGAGTLPNAPLWAVELAEQNMPGGAR